MVDNGEKKWNSFTTMRCNFGQVQWISEHGFGTLRLLAVFLLRNVLKQEIWLYWVWEKSGNLLSAVVSLEDALPWPLMLWRGIYFFPHWVPNFAIFWETVGCFLSRINHFCTDSLGLCSLQNCRWQLLRPLGCQRGSDPTGV